MKRMDDRKNTINLDEEIVRLRFMQTTLKLSENTVEEAFRIFIYACGIRFCAYHTPMHLMSASVYIAAKRAAEPIPLMKISKLSGIPGTEIFGMSNKILAMLIPEIDSLTIEKAVDLMSMLEQSREKERAYRASKKRLPNPILSGGESQLTDVGNGIENPVSEDVPPCEDSMAPTSPISSSPHNGVEKHATVRVDAPKQENISNGSVDVYAIDINNILTGFIRKYHSEVLWLKKFSSFLKNTAGSGGCQMFLFGSQPAARYIEEAKRYSNVTVFIESNLKSVSDHKYMDIDTMLCVEMTRWVLKNRERIRRFYIASGDKDFHTLVEMVRDEGIPVTVLIEDKKYLAATLVEAADSVKMILN